MTEAIFRAAVEHVVTATHGDNPVAQLIAGRYLTSEFWPQVVAHAITLDRAVHADRTFADISAQTTAG